VSGRGKQQALARRLEREAQEEAREEIIEEMAPKSDCWCRFAKCDPRPMIGQINFRIPTRGCPTHDPTPTPAWVERLRQTVDRLGLLP
jgi:hypothetical protein